MVSLFLSIAHSMSPAGYGVSSFSFIFSAMPILFIFVFFVVFGIVISVFIRSARQHKQNRSAPRVQTQATICAKRMSVHGSNHTHTDYYATFRLSSNDLMELSVPETDYGYLIEGDEGLLTFQGTLFVSFTRN